MGNVLELKRGYLKVIRAGPRPAHFGRANPSLPWGQLGLGPIGSGQDPGIWNVPLACHSLVTSPQSLCKGQRPRAVRGFKLRFTSLSRPSPFDRSFMSAPVRLGNLNLWVPQESFQIIGCEHFAALFAWVFTGLKSPIPTMNQCPSLPLASLFLTIPVFDLPGRL